MTTSIVSQSIPSTSTTGTTTEATAAPEVTDLAPPVADPPPAPPAPTERDLHDAYVRVEPECNGLTPEQLASINVDTGRAAAIVHASLPRVLALRALMAQLPAFDIAQLDRLGDYALALRYADVLSHTGHPLAARISELAEQTARARDDLRVHAEPFVHAGIIAAADLEGIGSSTGHSALAEDVLRLVVIYRRAWPAIAGRTLVTPAQLDAASDQATSLLAAVEQRDHAPVVIPAPVLNRQRIFTLFRRAYAEVRRGVVFLRGHEGDADEILPPLRTHSGPSKRDANGDGAEGDAGGAGGAGATGGNAASGDAEHGDAATHTQSSAQEFAEAAKMFAPPSDAKPAAATSLPRSKPFADA